MFVVLQWGEHVRHVDGNPSVHRGALQSASPAPEDGGQGDEPSTSLSIYRYTHIPLYVHAVHTVHVRPHNQGHGTKGLSQEPNVGCSLAVRDIETLPVTSWEGSTESYKHMTVCISLQLLSFLKPILQLWHTTQGTMYRG